MNIREEWVCEQAQDHLREVATRITPLNYHCRTCVTSKEIIMEMGLKVDRANTKIITAAMRRSGWTHRQMRVDGYPTWVWVAPVGVAEEGAA